MAIWTKPLMDICAKFNVEPLVAERDEYEAITKMAFNCPSELAGEEKASIIRTLPVDVKTEFTVCPKQSTINILGLTLRSCGIGLSDYKYEEGSRKLIARMNPIDIRMVTKEGSQTINAVPPQDNPFWDLVGILLKHDGSVDEWEIICSSISGERLIATTKQVKNLDEEDVKKRVIEGMNAVAAQLERNSDNSETESDPLPYTEPVQKSAPVIVPKEKGTGKREICPTVDEITDLKIALGQAETVEDFLKMI